MKRYFALILGALFFLDCFMFSFSNIGNPIEWTYWLLPSFTVDSGMMVAFITFYAGVAGYLIALYLSSKDR